MSENKANRKRNSGLDRKELFRDSYYDPLTGLPNMTRFFDLAEVGRSRMREEGTQPAILFLDLNGMKHFNSKYGFAAGNQLLKAFAELLADCFGSENCSRLAQDHFAVITEREGLEDRLEALFRRAEHINGGSSLPVRVGIYLDRRGQSDISIACDRARTACVADRDTYQSYYRFFNDSLRAEMENRQYIIDNIDKAVEENWIQDYYQPIIRAANGRVCNEEALARWVDPERGMLSPAEFIPVLEDTRLIYKLDLKMVDLILDKLLWQEKKGLFLVPISVNLSRSDFDSCDIVEEIRQRVDDSGIGREMLIIEITESTMGKDFEFMKSQIERFKALGFQVWMDDFGSGYSSLDVLQNIHFDLIKFDMRFMEGFEKGEESRIILTELIKMAIGLEVETLCEGVETQQQVDFLMEVGCNKLQGFFYCRPISRDGILERYETGKQIGFENPEESAYYSAIGGVNLYDLSAMIHEEKESFRRYFDTIPMAIIESSDTCFNVARCNRAYREFMLKMFGFVMVGVDIEYDMAVGHDGADFISALRQCGKEGGRIVVDEEMGDGSVNHALIRRVAVNPVKGTSAVAVALLAISERGEDDSGISYARVARALAGDYFNLFYVNLETDQFVEYTSDDLYGALAMERHGDDFFTLSRQGALKQLYDKDQEGFVRAFTKENVIRSLDENGTFTHTYRLVQDGKPVYVNMKAIRPKGDLRHMVIGVNNVDAQMREKEELRKLSEEKAIYGRIAALAGDFMAIYNVDPTSDSYVEYSSQGKYMTLGYPSKGDDFYGESRQQIGDTIHPDDLDYFLKVFTKENILHTIEESGRFQMEYRLIIDKEPVNVRLKAVIVEEKNGPVMVVGVNYAD